MAELISRPYRQVALRRQLQAVEEA
jgi:hypothetical protein